MTGLAVGEAADGAAGAAFAVDQRAAAVGATAALDDDVPVHGYLPGYRTGVLVLKGQVIRTAVRLSRGFGEEYEEMFWRRQCLRLQQVLHHEVVSRRPSQALEPRVGQGLDDAISESFIQAAGRVGGQRLE